MDTQQISLLKETAQIVASHVANNPMSPDQVTGLIRQVYSTLTNLGEAPKSGEEASQTASPAVPVNKSVKPDYIVCLEDGLQFKMLRRHLMASYNMTPEQYRTKWNLPADYPMVAPNYAETRSVLAKEIGLGTFRTSRKTTRPQAHSRQERAEPPRHDTGPEIKRIPEGVSGKRKRAA